MGVNTMIYSPSGASSGVGFAIPADTVRKVVEQLVQYGRVVRPGLGVVLLPDQVTANVLGLNIGVVIKDVVPGLGAQKAGLRCVLPAFMENSLRVAGPQLELCKAPSLVSGAFCLPGLISHSQWQSPSLSFVRRLAWSQVLQRAW